MSTTNLATVINAINATFDAMAAIPGIDPATVKKQRETALANATRAAALSTFAETADLLDETLAANVEALNPGEAGSKLVFQGADFGKKPIKLADGRFVRWAVQAIITKAPNGNG